MTKLTLYTNLSNHDDLYESIIKLYDGQSTENSLKISAKLVLLLANHIGDDSVIQQAIDLARPKSAKGGDNRTK